jgi:hypothetical protein
MSALRPGRIHWPSRLLWPLAATVLLAAATFLVSALPGTLLFLLVSHALSGLGYLLAPPESWWLPAALANLAVAAAILPSSLLLTFACPTLRLWLHVAIVAAVAAAGTAAALGAYAWWFA